MLIATVIARGNSLDLILPPDAGFKEGQRWLMIPSSKGASFTLVPRLTNPYLSNQSSADMTEEWPNFDYNTVDNTD
jgi:hypothetical protein